MGLQPTGPVMPVHAPLHGASESLSADYLLNLAQLNTTDFLILHEMKILVILS